MASYEREVRKFLQEHGCHYVRPGKGDHEIWWSPIATRHITVDSKIKSRHTANEVLKQAGIGRSFDRAQMLARSRHQSPPRPLLRLRGEGPSPVWSPVKKPPRSSVKPMIE